MSNFTLKKFTNSSFLFRYNFVGTFWMPAVVIEYLIISELVQNIRNYMVKLIYLIGCRTWRWDLWRLQCSGNCLRVKNGNKWIHHFFNHLNIEDKYSNTSSLFGVKLNWRPFLFVLMTVWSQGWELLRPWLSQWEAMLCFGVHIQCSVIHCCI